MRRSIPEPHLTDRTTMWRASGAVLAVAVVATLLEVLASKEPFASVAWTGVFPLIGMFVAPVIGPRLRPRTSFNVGRAFLVFGVLSAAVSTLVWHGSPIGVAQMFHYVTAVMIAALFFDRRDVHQLLGLIVGINTAVVFRDGYSSAQLLVWFLATVVIVETGIVVSILVQRQRELSYRDALTGGPNRRRWDLTLVQDIADCARRGRRIGVLIIDFDDFKGVNHDRGHDGGDEVLRAAVAAWCPLVRASDLLARLGGDEFALVLPDCGSTAAVERIGEVLVAACTEATGTTCSIGIATIVPPAGTVADGWPELAASLVHAADLRLYSAKAAGHACVRSVTLDDDPGEANPEHSAPDGDPGTDLAGRSDVAR